MPHITYISTAGLANRLRALAGYYALAQIQGLGLRVYWVLNRNCGAPFEQLFDPLDLEGVHVLCGDVEPAGDDDSAVARFSRSPDLHHIWLESGCSISTEEDFMRLGVHFLRKLRPAAPVMDRLEHLSAAMRIHERIGVHIRMTDNVDHYATWSTKPEFDLAKVSQLRGFREYLDELEVGAMPVFLATDNAAVEEELTSRFNDVVCVSKVYEMSRFGNYHRIDQNARAGRPHRRLATRAMRAISRLSHSLSRKPAGSLRTTSIEDAVVDLLLLSKCKSIVATYWSSFGLTAALIGGVPCMIMCGTRLEVYEHT